MSGVASSAQPFPLIYQQQGKGFPILCLHGHPGSSSCMEVFTEPLSQNFWTIAPDLRGYGRSQTRSPFTMQDHLFDLEALLDRLEIERCLVLGWSLGGILAMELALRQSQRIAGLILVATAARPVSNLPPTPLPILMNTAIAGVLNWLKPGWDWNIATFGQRSLLRDLITQHTPVAYQWLAQAGAPATLQTSRQAQQALAQALQQHYSCLSNLHQLTCPSLVLSGANDRHIISQASQETAQHLPSSKWICYPDVAHLFPWEIPSIVNRDIQHWLETHAEQIGLAGKLP